MTTSVVCSDTVDYSKVTGERVLPFRFTLNEEKSILTPQTGQFQRFCYDVEGVEEKTLHFADLQYFLLGICREITREDIREITVVINGVSQHVIWGENVEIKTEEHPDMATGCVGIKFNFPLDREDDFMEVCITMQHPFNVGPVNVCAFGGNVTATGLSICGPVCDEDAPCESTFFQTETVCVPVRVTPVVTPGEARARCCGEAEVHQEETCSGGRTSCTFTITQRLCIEIPLSFGAVIETGQATVQCGGVSHEDCDCDDDDEEEGATTGIMLPDRTVTRESSFLGGRRTRG